MSGKPQVVRRLRWEQAEFERSLLVPLEGLELEAFRPL
jgi:hypothetical protein